METENNLVDWLSETHREFILHFVERSQATEEAAINHWLQSKER